MFYRRFKPKSARIWGSAWRTVKFYRYCRSWAFYVGDGRVWCKRWGFRTPRAAVRGAARYLNNYRIMRERS